MATESFDMSLVIDNDDAAANFIKAIEQADARGISSAVYAVSFEPLV